MHQAYETDHMNSLSEFNETNINAYIDLLMDWNIYFYKSMHRSMKPRDICMSALK